MFKRIAFFLCVAATLCSAQTPQTNTSSAKPQVHEQQGEPYVFCLIRRPANTPQLDKAKLEELQAGHMANIKKLYDEGRLVMAGPFLDDTSLRGIFLYKTDSIEQAQQWESSDPSVKAGRLACEMHHMELPPGMVNKPESDSGPMQNYTVVVLNKEAQFRDLLHAPLDDPLALEHLKYLNKLFQQGKLVFGGPFFQEKSDARGVLIFTTNADETKQLMNEEPATKAGIFSPELHPWMTAKGVLAK